MLVFFAFGYVGFLATLSYVHEYAPVAPLVAALPEPKNPAHEDGLFCLRLRWLPRDAQLRTRVRACRATRRRLAGTKKSCA